MRYDITACDKCNEYYATIQGACPRCHDTTQRTTRKTPKKREFAPLRSKPSQRSNKHIVDGIRLDSNDELARYQYLKSLWQRGEISNLIPSPDAPNRVSYSVSPRLSFNAPVLGANRRVLSERKYTPDFEYDVIVNGKTYHIVEDVKPYKKSREGVAGCQRGEYVKYQDKLRIELYIRQAYTLYGDALRFRYITKPYVHLHPSELILD